MKPEKQNPIKTYAFIVKELAEKRIKTIEAEGVADSLSYELITLVENIVPLNNQRQVAHRLIRKMDLEVSTQEHIKKYFDLWN